MSNRLHNLLLGQLVDCVPAAPLYLGLYLAGAVRSAYIEQYRQRLQGLDRYQVDHDEDTAIRAEAIGQAYTVFKDPPDWLEVDRGASRAWAQRTAVVRQGQVLYYEDQETNLRVPMGAIALSTGNARLGASQPESSQVDLWDLSRQLEDEESIDTRLPVSTVEMLLDSGEYDLPRLLAAEFGDAFFVHTVLDTPYSDSYDWLGFQGLMLIQYERPMLFHYLLRRILAQAKVVVQAWASTGIQGIFAEEVFSGADMISPQSYAEFVFPYNQEYFSHLRGNGLLAVHYPCGDIMGRLEHIRRYEISALAVEESKKNFRIDLDEVVRQVGDSLVIFGNIDSVKYGLLGTQAEMAAEVRRHIQIGASACGFVVSTGSPFPLATAPQLIDCLVQTAHQPEI